MFKSHRAVHTALAMLLTIFLLAACGGEEPEETEASPTTGDTGAFEISGTVQQVEIEEGGESPGGTATPTGTGTSPAGATSSPAGPLARLVVEVESINEGPAELCDVQQGDQVTLTVTGTTTIDPQRSLQDLDDIEGRTIRAEGNAEELAGQDRGGNPTAEEEDTSPTGAASPQGGEGASPGGASPATGGAGSNAGQDPEAGCHFEVAKLTLEEQEEGQGGQGETTGSPGTTGQGSGNTGAGTGTGPGAGSGSPTGGQTGTKGGAGSPTPTGQAGTARTPEGAEPTSQGGGT